MLQVLKEQRSKVRLSKKGAMPTLGDATRTAGAAIAKNPLILSLTHLSNPKLTDKSYTLIRHLNYLLP